MSCRASSQVCEAGTVVHITSLTWYLLESTICGNEWNCSPLLQNVLVYA